MDHDDRPETTPEQAEMRRLTTDCRKALRAAAISTLEGLPGLNPERRAEAVQAACAAFTASFSSFPAPPRHTR